MIAKGNLHAHGAKLAAYLTTSYADETAELVELRGFAATNIRDAFIDVQIQAAATRATKPFFHAYVRAPEGEQLTRDPRPLPQMRLNPAIQDIHQFQYEDFELTGYNPHPAIRAPIAV